MRAPRFSVSAVSTVIESTGRADCLVESISGLIFPCFSIPSFGCVTDCGATARTRQPNGSPGVFGYFGDVTYVLGLAAAYNSADCSVILVVRSRIVHKTFRLPTGCCRGTRRGSVMVVLSATMTIATPTFRLVDNVAF